MTNLTPAQLGLNVRMNTNFDEALTRVTAALKAGKDVYIEKPMTIDLASANEALGLARASSRKRAISG